MTETSLDKLEQEARGYPEKASGIIVHNNETLNIANEFLKAVKVMRKKIKDTFDPIIKKAHDAHKEAVAKKKEYEGPLIKAEGEIKIRIAAYIDEQTRKAEEARKEAEKAEEQRLNAAHVMMDEAEHLEEKGNIQEAREMRERIPDAKPLVIPKIPKLEGTSVKRLVKWELIDIKKVPVEFLMVDKGKVSAYVDAHGERTNIPGIRVYTETSVATRL